MCEIFFQYSVDGESIDSATLQTLLQKAENASDRMSDGWGVFDEEGNTYKSSEQYDESDSEVIEYMFGDSQFVVIHLRLATNGSVKEENTHPFVYKHENGDKEILVHNGVIQANNNDIQKNNDETDSERILRAIAESDEDTTPERIEDAMEDVRGRTSIFLLDRNGELYYFRKSADFNMVYDRDVGDLLGTTNNKRIKAVTHRTELNFFEMKREGVSHVEEPKNREIYHITQDGITRVGKWGRWSSSGYVGQSTSKTKKDKQDEHDEDKNIEQSLANIPKVDPSEVELKDGEQGYAEEEEQIQPEDTFGRSDAWYDEKEGTWRDGYGNALPMPGETDNFDETEYQEALQEVKIA